LRMKKPAAVTACPVGAQPGKVLLQVFGGNAS